MIFYFLVYGGYLCSFVCLWFPLLVCFALLLVVVYAVFDRCCGLVCLRANLFLLLVLVVVGCGLPCISVSGGYCGFGFACCDRLFILVVLWLCKIWFVFRLLILCFDMFGYWLCCFFGCCSAGCVLWVVVLFLVA